MKQIIILILCLNLLLGFGFGGGGGDDDSDTNLTFNAIDYVSDDTCDAKDNWDDNLTSKIINKEFNLSILAKKDGDDVEANISKVQFYEYNNTNCDDGNVTIDICSGDDCGQTNSNGCLTLENIKIDRAVKCIKVHIEGNISENDDNDDNGWGF